MYPSPLGGNCGWLENWSGYLNVRNRRWKQRFGGKEAKREKLKKKWLECRKMGNFKRELSNYPLGRSEVGFRDPFVCSFSHHLLTLMAALRVSQMCLILRITCPPSHRFLARGAMDLETLRNAALEDRRYVRFLSLFLSNF